MSERMHPLPMAELTHRLFSEYEQDGSCFGVRKAYVHQGGQSLPLFRGAVEVALGPAAGPHTQLAQNIVAAYFAGARFFELKTVQKMDGEELAACIGRPCIYAPDEAYNCEWSTELTVPAAFEEYVKAWFLCRLLARRLGLGEPDGFMFNASVGYDLAGIKTPKVDAYLNGIIDASATPIFKECVQVLCAEFPEDQDFIQATPARICDSVTVSTLHGCPPQEIESIASYLITEKGLNTFVKCNPTLLGYETARETLDRLGYDYLVFSDHHFKDDLQFADAVPMLARLQALAKDKGLTFGVKLTNTMPVDIDKGQLPGEEMYMSGRSLYALTIQVARKISEAFQGGLPISLSGGVDIHNAVRLFQAGIRPLTVATTLLKPGGYQRLKQMAEALAGLACPEQVDVEAIQALNEELFQDDYYRKPIKTAAPAQYAGPPPLMDCFQAPCRVGCPLEQDVPAYLAALAKGETALAARIVLERNPLPHITGEICPHTCTDACNRRFYEQALDIRGCKADATRLGLAAALPLIEKAPPAGKKAVVVGAGPAGLASAALLSRAGWQVTLLEKAAQAGGLPLSTIPGFRIDPQLVAEDVAVCLSFGAELKTGVAVENLDQLIQDYDAVIVAVGAGKHGEYQVTGIEPLNAIDFLDRCKAGEAPDLGEQVLIVGGGNSAMDAARAALRLAGQPQVGIVYRRDRRNMPADEEELLLAEEEGVIFQELLSPVSWQDGQLTCEKMRLGKADASGRRRPEPTGELVALPCTSLIAATGETVDSELYAKYGLPLDKKGYPILNQHLQSCDNIYVVGDGAQGPATVAKAIAGALTAVEHITGKRFDAYREEGPYQETAARGVLEPGHCGREDAHRCLECGSFCSQCVEVCPNRANRLLLVDGRLQVLHEDDLCNECGNCAMFCPYEGSPYLDKLTRFSTEAEFRDSKNSGFVSLGGGQYLARVSGREFALYYPEQPSLAQLFKDCAMAD